MSVTLAFSWYHMFRRLL